MPSTSKPRARLSVAQVIAIFKAKASASIATRLATIYGVSEKAVRDIWTGRTWSRETWRLDTSRPLQLKLTGRPKGCRDTKPRLKRVNGGDKLSASTSLTVRASCSLRHSVAGHSFEQDAWHVWTAGLTRTNHSAACLDNSNAGNQCSATWWAPSTLRHASVDEQLHDWDEFWSASTSADPFCRDWKRHWSTNLAP
jgi:hypothetical protein